MTESHPDDEQLSAALDGLAGGDDVDSHLATCGACSARSSVLAAAAGRLRTASVAALAPSVLDAMVAKALATPAAAREPATIATVTPLRRRGRNPTPVLGRLAGVAAVVVVVLGLGTTMRWGMRLDVGNDSGVAVESRADRSAEDSSAPAAGAPAAAPLQESSDPAPPTASTLAPTAGGALPNSGRATADLGAVGDEAGLVAALRSAPVPGPDQSGPASAPPCLSAARRAGGSELGALERTATVRWRGEPAQVFVLTLLRPVDGSTRQALVLRPGTCAVLASPRL